MRKIPSIDNNIKRITTRIHEVTIKMSSIFSVILLFAVPGALNTNEKHVEQSSLTTDSVNLNIKDFCTFSTVFLRSDVLNYLETKYKITLRYCLNIYSI